MALINWGTEERVVLTIAAVSIFAKPLSSIFCSQSPGGQQLYTYVVIYVKFYICTYHILFAVTAPVLKAGHSKKVVAGRRLKLSCKVKLLFNLKGLKPWFLKKIFDDQKSKIMIFRLIESWSLGDEQSVSLASNLLVQGRCSPLFPRPSCHHNLQKVSFTIASKKYMSP